MRIRSFSTQFKLVWIGALVVAAIIFGMVPEAHAQGGNLPAQAPRIVGAATLVSPIDDIGTTYNPTYTWNKVADATHYYLWVNGPSGNVIKQWYNASFCGDTTCSATPDITLAGGAHTWWIRTWNTAGYGPWSAGMPFSTTIPPLPGTATLTLPTGPITDTLPTYTWDAVSGATQYYLFVNGPSGNVIKQWYQASAVCTGATCSIEHSTSLKAGGHNWWIRAWNTGGYGQWSTAMSFTVNPPGAATLVSPNSNITDNTPTYTWNETAGATHYYLWVNAPSGNGIIKQWYKAADVCAGGTCIATPDKVLGGAHTWFIRTWSNAGYGAWSASMAFTTPIPWPGQPTLISPNASTNNLVPTYTWNAITSETGDAATWYQFSLKGPSGNLMNKWYTAAEVGCSGGTGTCSATPDKVLIPGGTYTWFVRGNNPAGSGPWSTGMSFSHSSIGGFNSQFNGTAAGWLQYSGSWSILNGAWYGAYGSYYNYVTSAYTEAQFDNFDVQSRVYTDTPHEAYMIVRGSPWPLNQFADWSSGYYFGFDGYGFYTVSKMVNGTWTTLQPWTYTPYLNQGNWNTIRVIAAGPNLYYYINGTLVWSGLDYSLSSGVVGYELGTDPSHSLWIDWVTLNSYYARSADLLTITDIVSPEQQALNEAALNGVSDKVPGRNWNQEP